MEFMEPNKNNEVMRGQDQLRPSAVGCFLASRYLHIAALLLRTSCSTRGISLCRGDDHASVTGPITGTAFSRGQLLLGDNAVDLCNEESAEMQISPLFLPVNHLSILYKELQNTCPSYLASIIDLSDIFILIELSVLTFMFQMV